MITKQSFIALLVVAVSGCSSNFQLPVEVGGGQSSTIAQLDRTLYLRGDFTLWDAEPQYRLIQTQPGVSAAKANFPIPGKVYEFKIADNKWSEGYNCGYKSEGQLTLGVPLNADCNTVYNYFSFKPSRKGWYEIQFDYRNPQQPKVLLVKL